MTRKPDTLRDVPLRDLRAHPELVLDLLSGEEDVSVVLQKRGEVDDRGFIPEFSVFATNPFYPAGV
jgi:hypothetical protein